MSSEQQGPPPAEEPVEIGSSPEPAPAPPASPGTVRIALTATVLLAAAAITVTVVADDDTGQAARSVVIGDCVQAFQAGEVGLTGDEITAEPARAVDCKSPGAAYRVALQTGGAYAECPSPSYRVRRVGVGTPDERTLCMTYNVRSEECFVQAPVNLAGPYDCGLGPRRHAIRVLRVVEGVEDPMRCMGLAGQLLIVTVPEPATTFCYVEFGEGGTATEPGLRNA